LSQSPVVGGDLIWLEPDPLAVSCERVKDALLRQLGAPDRWLGQVHLWLSPNPAVVDLPPVVATRYPEAWRYDLHLPQQADPKALVRALLYTLLREIAERSPGSHAAELPIWLVEGLTGELLTTAGPDLVFQPNALMAKAGDRWAQVQPSIRNQRLADTRAGLRNRLRSHPPLTFNELSLPTPGLLHGENLRTYQACAQLFFQELQRLPRSQAALGAMLSQLTQTLNWQTAFLRAYEPWFPRLLDVEKWWAVTLAQFTGRDELHAWPREVSLDQLGQLLQVPVEVRARPQDLPQRRTVSLAQVIREWDYGWQTTILRQKINLLMALETDVPLDMVPLVEAYLNTLAGYLERRSRFPAAGALSGRATVEFGLLRRDTLRRLAALDRQRAKLAAAAAPAASAAK
jgi:hypothetical protein